MPTWLVVTLFVLVVAIVCVTIVVGGDTPQPSVAPAMIDGDTNIGRFDNSPSASY